jgi:4a-hydroxytetrahydrobiopterin dehydratase
MRDALLDDEQRAALLPSLPAWTASESELTRTVSAASFEEAIAWVVRIADAAAELDHHPDIDIRWRTLRLVLTTHDSGGITRRDVELAARIDEIVGG